MKIGRAFEVSHVAFEVVDPFVEFEGFRGEDEGVLGNLGREDFEEDYGEEDSDEKDGLNALFGSGF